MSPTTHVFAQPGAVLPGSRQAGRGWSSAARFASVLGRPTPLDTAPTFSFGHSLSRAVSSFKNCSLPTEKGFAPPGGATLHQWSPAATFFGASGRFSGGTAGPAFTAVGAPAAVAPAASTPSAGSPRPSSPAAGDLTGANRPKAAPLPVQVVQSQGAPVYVFKTGLPPGGPPAPPVGVSRPVARPTSPPAAQPLIRSEPTPADLKRPYHMQNPVHQGNKTVHSYG